MSRGPYQTRKSVTIQHTNHFCGACIHTESQESLDLQADCSCGAWTKLCGGSKTSRNPPSACTNKSNLTLNPRTSHAQRHSRKCPRVLLKGTIQRRPHHELLEHNAFMLSRFTDADETSSNLLITTPLKFAPRDCPTRASGVPRPPCSYPRHSVKHKHINQEPLEQNLSHPRTLRVSRCLKLAIRHVTSSSRGDM